MVKNFSSIGFILGIIYGISQIVKAYIIAPSIPGIYEVGFQTILICVYGLFAGLVGCFCGYFVRLIFQLQEVKKE